MLVCLFRATHRGIVIVTVLLAATLASAYDDTASDETANDASLSSDQIDRIDQLFSKWDQDGSPGAALGVIKDGELIYANGYGLADLEHDVPIDSSTVFYMASVSKHFLTMCILLLEEEGKLDLDDEIQMYLPDFPRYEAPLTIRHFIHHTSGVRDNLTLWSLSGNSILDHVDETAIYELIKRQKELNFTPGERYLYSNSCYFMLGMIVEKASGLSLRDYAEKHLFEPLGMEHTHFHDDVDDLIKNRAFSYRPSLEGFRNNIMRYDLVGSGGLYSNIEDMVLWDRNFNENRLGKGGPALIQKMQEEGLLNNGESSGYAFGLTKGNYRGLKSIGHGGALAGYRTFYIRFPELKVAIVLLANSSRFDTSVGRDVAAIVLEDELEPLEASDESAGPRENGNATPNRRPDRYEVEVDLNEYVGSYFSEELNTSYELSLENKNLKCRIANRYGSPWLLIPSAKDRFVTARGYTFRFAREDDSVNGFKLDAGRVVNLVFEKQ